MGEEQEYALYNRVKNAEYARQKREQAVRKTQGKLLERRRDHAQKLKQEMIEMTKEERELEYQLERQKAELAKVRFSVLCYCVKGLLFVMNIFKIWGGSVSYCKLLLVVDVP